MLDSTLLFLFGLASGIVLAVAAEGVIALLFLDALVSLITGRK